MSSSGVGGFDYAAPTPQLTGTPYLDELLAAPIIKVCYVHVLSRWSLVCVKCNFNFSNAGVIHGHPIDSEHFMVLSPKVTAMIYHRPEDPEGRNRRDAFHSSAEQTGMIL